MALAYSAAVDPQYASASAAAIVVSPAAPAFAVSLVCQVDNAAASISALKFSTSAAVAALAVAVAAALAAFAVACSESL
jgi:hypothetical protein